MARSVRIQPHIYFGNPGSYIRMPWPRSGMSTPVDKPIYDFVSGSGNHRVSSLLATPRSYVLNWDALHQSTFDQVNTFWLGLNGPGPFVIIDPSRPNLLTANQSSAGSFWKTTADVVKTAGHGTLQVNKAPAFILRQFGLRSLQLLQDASTLTTLVTMSPSYAKWPGIPVCPGLPYTFSYSGTPDMTVDSSISNWAQMVWLTATGTVISTATGATSTLGGWNRCSVISTAPANAAFVSPSIAIDGTTMAVGASFYMDMMQLEQDSVVNDWAPGTGVQPVAIMGLNEDEPFDAWFRASPTMTLRELK